MSLVNFGDLVALVEVRRGQRHQLRLMSWVDCLEHRVLLVVGPATTGSAARQMVAVLRLQA